MSSAPMTTQNVGWARRFVREKISPRVTRFYAWSGFGNRLGLTTALNNLGAHASPETLDQLASMGILKERFRGQVSETSPLAPFMIDAGKLEKAMVANIDITGLDVDSLFAERSHFIGRVSTNIIAGCETIALGVAGLKGSDSDSRINAGTIIAMTAAVIAAVPLLWWVYVPAHVPVMALSLATSTAVSLIATEYNNRLPLRGILGPVGSSARFVSRTIAPFVYAGDAAYSGYILHQSDLHVPNLLPLFDLGPTTGIILATILTVAYYARRAVQAHKSAYLGKLLPGKESFERRQVFGAFFSNLGEFNYGIVRTLLFGAVSGNIFGHLGALGSLALLAPPAIGALTSAIYNGLNLYKYDSEGQAKFHDHMRIYSLFWGLGAGAVASVAIGLGTFSAVMPVAFFTFYGSLATLFLVEFFNIFHTTNTNSEQLVKLRSSAADLVGENEMRELADKALVMMHNPYTGGTKDHSRGLTLSLLLNDKPNVVFFCSLDVPVFADKGKFDDFHRNEEYLEWAVGLQAECFNRINHGIDMRRQALRERYAQLVANLNSAAGFLEVEAKQLFETAQKEHPEWFEVYEEHREPQNAAYNQLRIRAEKIRTTARQLEAKLQRGWIDEADFAATWDREAGCYDPDLVTVVSFPRKSIRGDDLQIRKVENVASPMLWRGITIYKLEVKERAEDLDTVKDIIAGKWSQVRNPKYDRTAEPGTFKASKYLTVPTRYLLADLQKRNALRLSTSHFIAGADNQPTEAEGFRQKESGALTMTVNNQLVTIPADECFYVPDPHNPRLVPSIKRIVPRQGFTEDQVNDILRSNHYRLGHYNGEVSQKKYMYPDGFTLPAFDFSHMADRNDAQIRGYRLLPAIVLRHRRDNRSVQFTIKQSIGYGGPIGWLIGKIKLHVFGIGFYQFADPHPEKEYDERFGLEVVDKNVEISATVNGREYVIPYEIARNTLHLGIDRDPKFKWEKLNGARIVIAADGSISRFSFIYSGAVERTELQIEDKWKQNQLLSQLSVFFENPKAKLLIFKPSVDEALVKARVADPEQQAQLLTLLKQSHRNISDDKGDYELVMPKGRWPRFYQSLQLPPGEHVIQANNFMRRPYRKGDMSWIKIHYTDGTVGFSRCADGKRPLLCNKDLATYKGVLPDKRSEHYAWLT